MRVGCSPQSLVTTIEHPPNSILIPMPGELKPLFIIYFIEILSILLKNLFVNSFIMQFDIEK